MNDTLRFLSKDPVYRKYDHGSLTFSMIYAFTENFILPLSHDEVVHGKGSLLDKMPGDIWQKVANLRLLYGYMYGHPGKKLLFMGSEIAQWREWNHDQSLDWHLLQWRDHQGILRLVCDLNALYRSTPALYQVDFEWQGYEWLELHDWENSVIAFLRRARDPDDSVVVVCNFTPVVRENYRVGVPCGGYYREILNTDSDIYGGSNVGNYGGAWANPRAARGPAVSSVAPPAALGRGLPQDPAINLRVKPVLDRACNVVAATNGRWRGSPSTPFSRRDAGGRLGVHVRDHPAPRRSGGDGDRQAAADLLPLVYDELRKLAAARMAAEKPGHTLDATALVHEAYLRLIGDQHFDGRGHFFAAAAEAMRRVLVNHARDRNRLKRGGGRTGSTWTGSPERPRRPTTTSSHLTTPSIDWRANSPWPRNW